MLVERSMHFTFRFQYPHLTMLGSVLPFYVIMGKSLFSAFPLSVTSRLSHGDASSSWRTWTSGVLREFSARLQKLPTISCSTGSIRILSPARAKVDCVKTSAAAGHIKLDITICY